MSLHSISRTHFIGAIAGDVARRETRHAQDSGVDLFHAMKLLRWARHQPPVSIASAAPNATVGRMSMAIIRLNNVLKIRPMLPPLPLLSGETRAK